MKMGLIQIYTGNGKGKTTASVGLAIRALGHGYKVAMIQFLKGSPTGEMKILTRLSHFKLYRYNSQKKFIIKMKHSEKDLLKDESLKGYQRALELLEENKIDLLILDEVFWLMHEKIIDLDMVISLINKKPAGMELILTGRNAPPEIIAMADLVTEMNKIKHPYDQGIKSRKGIEN